MDASASGRAIGIHRVIADQGLVAAVVAVLHAMHQAVGQIVQHHRGAGLINTGRRGSAHRRIHIAGYNRISRHKRRACRAKVRVGRCGPVYMEVPDAQRVAGGNPGAVVPFSKGDRRAGGRSDRAFPVRGQHAAIVAVVGKAVEVNALCCAGRQHLRTFHGQHACAAPSTGLRKLINCHVVAIRP